MEKRMDQAVMTEQDVLRYLQLVDRRVKILLCSGVDWKPEYVQELEDIDKELAVLRNLVDAVAAAKKQSRKVEPVMMLCVEAPRSGSDLSVDAEDGLSESDLDQIVCNGCACLDCARDYCGDPVSDRERQQLKDEVRQAYLNGGRTGWLHDIDGNEYYTTRDGVRHYTRVEG